ncbi:unnamed protein product [Heligmosomoides polygyrus]|uniref:Integrase_H2C2 domain-containing protein n=1 Tax=Heligmosomoides polygyrus TaxID=6339 RepID=A0A3P7T9X2_HELPZ|nr:unnamed protein product [Heligmosomoides polygyrus]
MCSFKLCAYIKEPFDAIKNKRNSAITLKTLKRNPVRTQLDSAYGRKVVGEQGCETCTQSSQRLPLFVVNQVDRIQRISPQIQDLGILIELNYIESKHISTDVATRPTSREQFELRLSPEHEWPIESTPKEIVDQYTEHIVEESPVSSCTASRHSPTYTSGRLIDLSRFRHYLKTLSVLTRGMKILASWISKTNHIDISTLQLKHKDKSLFRDENHLINTRSRLINSAFLYDTKEPMRIPKESDLLRLIVSEIHETNMHCGRKHTLSLLRMQFWTPKPSSKNRKILSTCTVCKREWICLSRNR